MLRFMLKISTQEGSMLGEQLSHFEGELENCIITTKQADLMPYTLSIPIEGYNWHDL